MRFQYPLLLAVLLPLSAKAWFVEVPAERGRDLASMPFTLDEYRSIRVDPQELAQYLDAAGAEAAMHGVRILLPLADGGSIEMGLLQSAVMHPELAARYPQIRSFRAVGVERPEVVARLEHTPLGFGAMLFMPEGAQIIAATRLGEREQHIVYRRAVVHGNQRPSCAFDEQADLALGLGEHLRLPASTRTVTGATFRTYRLAMATTGEYTGVFGGTVAGGLAAVVVAMNRVNEVYQTDLGVRMQLIANNDQIIYTDPANDPYTNNNGSTMLGQNQTNLDAVIGNANYDVGHVFSTGGGGVASLGVPCRTGFKARGVTGLSNPVGDPFYIDYVAHEIGHQFGANHTFNSTTSSCGGNRSASSAYEPGSGSTILSYAGICGSANLQSNSDPYFHARSLESMQAYISGANGDSCPTRIDGGGNLPLVDAGADANVPALTPLLLRGSASNVGGNPQNHIFEQYNLGTASPPEEDNGTRPIFRSFLPTATPERILPRRSAVLAGGAPPFGEVYPSTNRNLDFRYTVRELRTLPGGIAAGVTVSDDVRYVVSNAAGPFRVTAPTAGSNIAEGEALQVTWDVANTDTAPINCAQVEIALSSDGGQNFDHILLASTPNDGSESLLYSGPSTTTARLRVRCTTQPFFNVNPGNFTIAGGLFADGFE